MAYKRLNRLYKISDPDMLVFAQALRSSFLKDQADFVAYNAGFASPYETEWENLIKAAYAVPTDEQVKDISQQLIAEVKAKMKAARQCFQGAKPFIRNAFPDDATKWELFGFSAYRKDHRTQAAFIQFLYLFHKAAVKHSAQLIAVHFTQAKIDDIKTKADELNAAKSAQEDYGRSTTGLTDHRITTMNAVWQVLTAVAEAGKFLYAGNWAKYRQYVLPPFRRAAKAGSA